MDRIFEPFYTTQPPEKGTGLGLSTVYRIVTQLSGAIGVESIPGQSTVFTVYVPAVQSAAEAAGPQTQEPETGPSAESVLLVEDEENVRRLVSHILREAGYRVLAAADGTEGMALAASHPGRLDLLLTDLRLPGLQGADLAKELRKRDANLKVIFLSGDPSVANLTEDDVVLEKPFSPTELLGVVREVLRSGRRHRAGK